ncbi:MAG: hypothetical protein GY795_16940 [Desulfobacterales bacterium]|nr:hypothetical protein [Desulfobacterales bacterium]
MTGLNKIKLFRKTFRGRQDVVPDHWISLKTGKTGYTPLCRNEWQRPTCLKGNIISACKTCKSAEYIPVSDSLIREHFRGKRILGTYPMLADNTCNFIGADFDNHENNKTPLDDVAAYYEICSVQEIPCYVVRSKSGKGYHAFIFFREPVPAWKARLVSFALLQEAEIVNDDTELSSFDRLFPNQDRLSGKNFGNLIALPFQGKAAKHRHTLLLDPDSGFAKPYADQWKALAEIKKISECFLDDLITDWNLKQTSTGILQACETRLSWGVNASQILKKSDTGYPVSDFARIAEKCHFIAHCRDDAKILSEPDWYILLTISARCRDGERLSHKLSEPYPDYTPLETEAKINHALKDTGPYRCQTIKRINGKYCRACRHFGKVRSPIVLGTYTQLV